MTTFIPRNRVISADCRFFRGDRPCGFHKSSGVLCPCDNYSQVTERVLIIKLDAMGDVLRTTALLPALAEVHPQGAITWVTRRESVPLLQRNPFVSEVIEYGPDALAQLQAQMFDRVINLDASRTSAALAGIARSTRKDGYVMTDQGVVTPTNEAARYWLEMGVFDDLKRSGTHTYQEVMSAILGLESDSQRYVLHITDDEKARARHHLESLGVRFDRPVIGLNTGAGGRWELKQWRSEGYLELMARLSARLGCQLVLLGGPSEHERHAGFMARTTVPLVDGGCDNPVRHFAALVSYCDLVITGDTLAMHLALALKRRTVVLFGPTSSAEIELYGLGEKVVPKMDCLSCYKNTCDFVPNCMDLITVEMVEAAVMRQLAIATSTVDAGSVL